MKNNVPLTQAYKKSFYIEAPVSNNEFSYNKRPQKKIKVASLIEGGLDDLKIGDDVVFEDYDSDSELLSCKGLKNFIYFQNGELSVYIVDNHNHVFYFWYLERTLGLLKDGAILIHVDQHKDSRTPDKNPPENLLHDLDAVFNYTNTTLNVGNFIVPAVNAGLFSDVINITSEAEMISFKAPTNKQLVLDLDMDFFAPELDYIDNIKKIDFLRTILEKVSLVTIATSPFFVDQQIAINYLRKIFL